MNKIISNNKVFIKYVIFAGISFILDIALFHLFKNVFNNLFLKVATLTLVSTYLARAISSLFNYIVNRNAVFKNEDGSVASKKTIFEYYLLVVFQATMSGLIVGALTKSIHIDSTLIKVPVDCVIFLVNFFVQRYYIFNTNRKRIIKNENIRSLIFGIATSFSFLVPLSKKSIIDISQIDNNLLLGSILAILLMFFYKRYNNKYIKNNKFTILSVILSLLTILGYSYKGVGTAYLAFGNISFIIISIIKLLSLTTFYNLCINIFYELLCTYKVKEIVKKSKLLELFNKYPFIFSFIVILICFLPYYIAFYPTVMSYDPANQIKEFMGIENRYWDSIIMIDPSVTITNFNPVLHTLLLGGCFNFGYNIGNVNFGLFIYVIIQSIIYISVLSYSIVYMKKQGVSNKLLFIVLGMYSLIPVFPFYAITTNKDTIFCSFVFLYCIKLYDLIKNKQRVKDYIILLLIMIMVMLMRNNGIYTIFLSLPFALIWSKEKRKGILVTLVIVLLCFIGYNKVLLPTLKISNTSIREALSIPFQQTARLAKYHPDAFSEEDKEVVDKVLTFDTLAERYDPNLSDHVKNGYNKYTTTEELMDYFKVWAKGLIKHPIVYINATVNNVYGYFYPNRTSWYIYYKYNTKLEQAGFDYHFNSLDTTRSILSSYGKAYPKIPILGLFVNIGFVCWVYLFLFTALLVRKAYKYLPYIFISLSFILVCIASPANTYFRYALPYIMTLPFTICMLYYLFQKEK